MKSAIEWFVQLKIPFGGDVTIQDFILVQDDARADILTRIKSLEEQNAKLREALQKAVAGAWDGHYSGKGITVEYARSIDKEAREALNALELEPKDQHDA